MSGLEALTCRLRKDPTLRMLLWSVGGKHQRGSYSGSRFFGSRSAIHGIGSPLLLTPLT